MTFGVVVRRSMKVGVIRIKFLNNRNNLAIPFSTSPTMIVFALLPFLLKLCVAEEECVIDNRSLKNAFESKLRKDLKCDYDAVTPPSSNETHPLIVHVQFMLKTFKFNSLDQKFTAYTLSNFTWLDPRLSWDPETYNGLKQIWFPTYKIWTPIVKLYNSISDDINSYYYGICEINYDGRIYCMGQFLLNAVCNTDLRNWPYDSQKCQLIFGQMTFGRPVTKLQLSFNKPAMIVIESEHGVEWDIIGYKQEEGKNADKQLTMTFSLERHAGVLSAIIVYPCIVLTVLSISILFIDADNVRIVLICFSLMCHYDFLTNMGEHVPSHNKTSPLILHYFQCSLFMTAISLILTHIFRVFMKSDRKVHNFILKFNIYVFNSYWNFLIRPRWVVRMKSNKEFVLFCNIINVIWIYITVIVYFIMYLAFVPTYKKVSNIGSMGRFLTY